jgi:purine-binding chemotaxis protein CheW
MVKLGDEQFGIDIRFVDNIVRMQRITRVPKSQPHFFGVINIRGEIIPVMSLRVKFGLRTDEFTNTTRILIIKFEASSAVGIIVDEVREVVTLEDDSLDHTSNSSGDDRVNSNLIGVGKHADGLISVLNITDVVIDKDYAV